MENMLTLIKYFIMDGMVNKCIMNIPIFTMKLPTIFSEISHLTIIPVDTLPNISIMFVLDILGLRPILGLLVN
jgi:hypothetical protein